MSVTHQQTERFSSDPRDRLRAGCARDLATAAELVKRACEKEQREILGGHQRDGTTPPAGMTGTLADTYAAAEFAAWHWRHEHAEFVKRLATRLTDAGLFAWAEALESGDYSRLGW